MTTPKDKEKDKTLLLDDEKSLIAFLEGMVEEVLGETETSNEDEVEDDTKPLYEGWLEEASYPEGFDIKEFKSIPNFKKRIEYIKTHLGKHLGQGSSRIVFPVDQNTVVKIAKNKKGVAQNQVEADVSQMGYECIANVFDYDEENFLFLEMERATKLKKSDWKKITGYNFDEWMMVLVNYHNLNLGRRIVYNTVSIELSKEIQDTELFNAVISMMADFDMPIGDVNRTSSWGVVQRAEGPFPVMVDYGLTNTVARDFY